MRINSILATQSVAWGVAGTALAFTALLLTTTGGIRPAWYWLLGYQLYVDSVSVANIEDHDQGADTTEPDSHRVATIRFQLRNLGSREIVISGFRSTCACVGLTELPVIVPAKGQNVLEFRYRIPVKPEKESTSILLFLNVDHPPVILRLPRGPPSDFNPASTLKSFDSGKSSK